MKKTLGIKWIVDFRDPWTQFPFFERKPYLTRRINKGLEKVVLRYADRVIANTPSNRENLLREYPFIEGKVEVITNGFDPENIMAVKEVNHTANLDSKFVFVYTGELYRRMSDGLFNALYDLKKNSPDISERIEIKIAGLMWEEDIARIEELNIGDIVKYLGFISSSECNRLLAEADALLYLLPGSDEFKHWIPSKLYNYIASGKSILGILPDGDASAIIREVNGGYCLIPDDLRGIQEAITTLMSRKGEITFQRTPELENYSYVQLTKKLSLLCDQVTDLS